MKRRRLGGIRISIVALLNGVDNGCECNVVSSVGEGSAMNFTLLCLKNRKNHIRFHIVIEGRARRYNVVRRRVTLSLSVNVYNC